MLLVKKRIRLAYSLSLTIVPPLLLAIGFSFLINQMFSNWLHISIFFIPFHIQSSTYINAKSAGTVNVIFVLEVSPYPSEQIEQQNLRLYLYRVNSNTNKTQALVEPLCSDFENWGFSNTK